MQTRVEEQDTIFTKSGKTCRGEYFPVEEEGLTFERFLDHVHLKKTYVVFNKDWARMVNCGLFDIDVFPPPDFFRPRRSRP